MKKLILILTVAFFASCAPMQHVGKINSVFRYNVLLYEDYRQADKSFNTLQKCCNTETRQLIRADSLIIIQLFPGDSLTKKQADHWYVRDIYNHKFYSKQ